MSHTTTLAQLLMTAADRGPGRPALRDQGRALTWAQASDEAGRLGAALDLLGVEPGDRVGVHHRKSAQSFLAMHAVVQRGAIAVPLDPTASADYLATVAHQTSCRVVLSHAPCRRSALALAEADGPVRAVVGIDRPTAADPNTAGVTVLEPGDIDALDPLAPRTVDPDALAYIITTSGSTGVPKGISHTHRSALAYVAFKQAAYDLGPDDRISDIAPSHFDISTLALWTTPAIGATNVVVPEQYQMLPASLSQLMADEAITVWYSVPYLLTQLLNRGQLDDRDLTSLRWVLFGGEVFPPAAMAELMARLPGARFSNVYGPAEVNACTIHHLDGPPDGAEPIPIGRPVADTAIRLVDPDTGADLGPGSEAALGPAPLGEIWVSAPTMMAGYWERPDLDNAAIVTAADGVRWYRTGDLGYRLPTGALVFTGRVDHQVKVRGHRIELEAIEAVLEDADGVTSAVAAVGRHPDGADVVVAAAMVAPGAVLDPDALRAHATRHLPAYAVPVSFEALHSLPTTGSGKLDRRALRAQLAATHRTGATPVA